MSQLEGLAGSNDKKNPNPLKKKINCISWGHCLYPPVKSLSTYALLFPLSLLFYASKCFTLGANFLYDEMVHLPFTRRKDVVPVPPAEPTVEIQDEVDEAESLDKLEELDAEDEQRYIAIRKDACDIMCGFVALSLRLIN